MAIAFLAMGVWAHHMFTAGMSRVLDFYFAAASFLISIPTGIKIFNWLATIYGGKISFASPMLFALGFLSMFVLGGLTGIMLACAPFDYQLSDTYFVVGRLHWVLIGGTLFGVFLPDCTLLVSQSDGTHALRAAGALAILALAQRLHLDVWADAFGRHAGHAAMPNLYP